MRAFLTLCAAALVEQCSLAPVQPHISSRSYCDKGPWRQPFVGIEANTSSPQ